MGYKADQTQLKRELLNWKIDLGKLYRRELRDIKLKKHKIDIERMLRP